MSGHDSSRVRHVMSLECKIPNLSTESMAQFFILNNEYTITTKIAVI